MQFALQYIWNMSHASRPLYVRQAKYLYHHQTRRRYGNLVLPKHCTSNSGQWRLIGFWKDYLPTVTDFWQPPRCRYFMNLAPPGMYKTCKYWDKLPTSTGTGFLPSTISIYGAASTTRLAISFNDNHLLPSKIQRSIWKGNFRESRGNIPNSNIKDDVIWDFSRNRRSKTKYVRHLKIYYDAQKLLSRFLGGRDKHQFHMM